MTTGRLLESRNRKSFIISNVSCDISIGSISPGPHGLLRRLVRKRIGVMNSCDSFRFMPFLLFQFDPPDAVRDRGPLREMASSSFTSSFGWSFVFCLGRMICFVECCILHWYSFDW